MVADGGERGLSLSRPIRPLSDHFVSIFPALSENNPANCSGAIFRCASGRPRNKPVGALSTLDALSVFIAASVAVMDAAGGGGTAEGTKIGGSGTEVGVVAGLAVISAPSWSSPKGGG